MPTQVIAPADADDPGLRGLNAQHLLAGVAARHCQQHATEWTVLIGDTACGSCWTRALFDDMMFAHEHDLPLDLAPDPTYIDEIAVERAMRGEPLELTELERAEVKRRLTETRTRRNRSYAFVCSRAAAARREVQR